MLHLKGLAANLLKPLGFIMSLCSKKALKAVWAEFYSPGQTDAVKALSAAFGVFMGIIPIWGLQTVTALFLSVVFKLNKAIVALFLMVSFPPLMPVVIYLSYKAGLCWMGSKAVNSTFDTKLTLRNINVHLEQYLYGSISLAIAASAVFGLLTFALLKTIKSLKHVKAIAN